MKKATTLAEQVRDAQRSISSWSPQKKEAARLEGADIYLNRDKIRMNYTESLLQPKKR